MKYFVFLIVLTAGAQNAHAVSFKDYFKTFCEKYLIVDDPSQWDEAPTQSVIDQYLKTAARYNWAKHPGDAIKLRLMGNNLRLRLILNDPFTDLITDMLESYQHFENPHGL